MAEEIGIGFLGIGFQPKWGLKDIPIMPKVHPHLFSCIFDVSIVCRHPPHHRNINGHAWLVSFYLYKLLFSLFCLPVFQGIADPSSHGISSDNIFLSWLPFQLYYFVTISLQLSFSMVLLWIYFVPE